MEEVKDNLESNQEKELTPEEILQQKKVLRKLNKQEKKLQKYQAVRELKKKQRNQRVRAKRKQRAEMFANMTEGNLYSDEISKFKSDEQQQNFKLTTEADRVFNEGIPLVIDMSYCELMSPQEIKSLVLQICQTIGYIRKYENQVFKIICTSITPELEELITSMSKGKWKIHLCSLDVMSIPEAESHEIVMLSPDATDSLDAIHPNSMYVIGGLVDRTRKKAESLKKAMERRVKCVKLPIREEISIVFYM